MCRAHWCSPVPAGPSPAVRTPANPTGGTCRAARCGGPISVPCSRPCTMPPFPAVSAVEGYALGGGLELALAGGVVPAVEDGPGTAPVRQIAAHTRRPGRLPTAVGCGQPPSTVTPGSPRNGSRIALRVKGDECMTSSPHLPFSGIPEPLVLQQRRLLPYRSACCECVESCDRGAPAPPGGSSLPCGSGVAGKRDCDALQRTTALLPGRRRVFKRNAFFVRQLLLARRWPAREWDSPCRKLPLPARIHCRGYLIPGFGAHVKALWHPWEQCALAVLTPTRWPVPARVSVVWRESPRAPAWVA